jgi:hypothetical protein
MAESPKQANASGTILRGQDGSVYFIRDEILEACRLSGEELKLSERTLEAAKKVPFIQASDSVRLEREMPVLEFQNIKIDPQTRVASTVMCCW